MRGQDRKHLVHHGAGFAAVELATSDGSFALRLDASGSRSTALLKRDEAIFFRERCYLAQTTLGRLLEIYQSADGHGDSPLTRFVKDLLRLDELDALIDGIEAVRDKRLVKRLVPEYARVEDEAALHDERIALVGSDLQKLSAATESLRGQIATLLDGLGAPAAIRSAREPEDIVQWLAESDDEGTLVAFITTQRELQGLRARWAAMADTPAAAESIAAEHDERVARRAADAWRASHGRTLERLLDALREDCPELRLAAGSADPAEMHRIASEQVAIELKRSQAAISVDALSLVETQRLDVAVNDARARIEALDEQLSSHETASMAEELGRALAAVAPHIHGSDCPVCGRDYDEVSEQPLAAHVALRISELGARTERLRDLAKARLKAVNDLSSAQRARDALPSGRMDRKEKAGVREKIRRLERARQELAAMSSGVAEGAKVLRRSAEAERARALTHRRDRSGAEIRADVTALSASAGLPRADDPMPIGEKIERLAGHTQARSADLELRQASRRAVAAKLTELADATRTERELQASLAKTRRSRLRAERNIKELERCRKRIQALRREAESSRRQIVRRIFNDSLNRMWRDLFVCLAPDEPFVPAFHVPDSPGEPVVANLQTVHRDGRRGGSPAAMLSAGNLNTAALTLFLALHLSAERKLPWLLLDDPVQSMDEVGMAV